MLSGCKPGLTVSGLVKSSLADYPGLVACVLFVPGCNYDCFYCHNRSLIDGTHAVMLPGPVEEFLKKRAGLLDAVVISGGEPTLQPGLVSAAEHIKELGYKLKLDTNGSSPQVVAALLRRGLFDYYAVDYKAPADRYAEICGAGAQAEAVRETVGLLLDAGAAFEVRTTVIPQLDAGDLTRMAAELPVLPRYVLNRYRKPEKYRPEDRFRLEKAPYTQAEIGALADLIRSRQPNVII